MSAMTDDEVRRHPFIIKGTGRVWYDSHAEALDEIYHYPDPDDRIFIDYSSLRLALDLLGISEEDLTRALEHLKGEDLVKVLTAGAHLRGGV